VVVPEKQGLKPIYPIDMAIDDESLSGGSRKTRIETPAIDPGCQDIVMSKWWFQKNKD
jgi:hypothetical protein